MPSLSIGVETTVVGLTVVFSVLIILSLTIWILTKILNREGKAPSEPAQVPVSPSVAETNDGVRADGISPKLVSAIMAAVSAASGRPVANLKFTAIRREHGVQGNWGNSGNSEIINTRQQYL